MSVFENGFLDSEANEKRDFIIKSYNDIYSFYSKINEDAHSMFRNSYSLVNDSAERFTMVCLFMRSLTLSQSIYFISQRGMLAESRILLRSLIETIFSLVASSVDDSILKVLELKDEKQKLKFVNRIINSKHTIKNIPGDTELNKIKEEIISRINNIPIQSKTTEDISRIANMHDYYLTVYSHLCNSVHTNLIDFESNLVQSENKLIGLSYGPTDDYLMKNIITMIDLVLRAMKSINKYFSLNEDNLIEAQFRKLKTYK